MTWEGSAPTLSQYKIRLVTNVAINHFVTLVSDLTIFSNTQSDKDLRRYAQAVFAAKVHYSEDLNFIAMST